MTDIERLPAPSPSLPSVIEDVVQSFYTGAPLPDATRDVAKGMLRGFVDKSMVINMMTLAHMQERSPRTLRALMSLEDYVYDPRYISSLTVDPATALAYHKFLVDSVMKTIEMSTKFAKDISASMEKGMDPEQHLHLHVHSPLEESIHPSEVVEDVDLRRRIAEVYQTFADVVTNTPPPPPIVRKSRLVPSEHAPPPGGYPDDPDDE